MFIPTLYNLFISDLPINPNCETALFADDLAIYCSLHDPVIISNYLQRYANEIIKYYESWRLKINCSKTQAAFFTKRRALRFLPGPHITINNSQIKWNKQIKYLGVTLDSSLTFYPHIQNTLEKIKTCIHTYYPFISRSSKLSQKNKLILYKVVFQAIILYAAPVWHNCAKTHKQKLQIIQNKTLKIIAKLPRHFSTYELHTLTNITYITDAIDERSIEFFKKCRDSSFNTIRDIAL